MTLQETAALSIPESHLMRFLSKEDRASYPVATATPMNGWWIVTPEVARAWLEKNTDNFRPLNGDNAEELQREMERGAWLANPAPVSFVRGTGVLADGQHRLTALASSDAAIVLHVFTDTHPEAVDKLDIGRKRSAANILARKGISEPQIAASMARFLFARSNQVQDSAGFNVARVAEYGLSLPGIGDTAHRAVILHRMQARKLLRPSAMGVALYLIDDERFDEMLEQCCSLSRMEPGGASQALVRRALNREEARSRGQSRERAFVEVVDICTAWDYFRHGVQLKQLKTPAQARWFNLPGIDYVADGVKKAQRVTKKSA